MTDIGIPPGWKDEIPASPLERLAERFEGKPARFRPRRHGVYLVRFGARRFAFVLRSLRRYGEVRLTPFYKTRGMAAGSLYRDWPNLFFEWFYNGQREGKGRGRR